MKLNHKIVVALSLGIIVGFALGFVFGLEQAIGFMLDKAQDFLNVNAPGLNLTVNSELIKDNLWRFQNQVGR